MSATSGAIRAGKAFVELLADDTKLQAGLKQAQKQIKAFGKGVADVGKQLATLGAAATVPLLAAVKTFADAGSGLYDMSLRTGIAVEALGELSYAAKLSGAEMGTLENGIRKMQKTLVDAASGSKGAADAFANIGLDASKLGGMSPDQQFIAIAEAISKIQDPTQKAAAAMEIFGKSGTMLLPMMDEGAAGLAKMGEEARNVGAVMSTDAAMSADALGDAMDAMHKTLTSVVLTVGAQLAPAITTLSEVIGGVAGKVREWLANHQELAPVLLAVAAGVTAVGTAMVVLGPIIATVVAALAGITVFLATNPFALLAVGVAMIAASFVDWGDVVKRVTGDVVKNVDSVGMALKGLEGASKEAQLDALESSLEKLREERKALEEEERSTRGFQMTGTKEEVDKAGEAWAARRKQLLGDIAANKAADQKLVDEIVPRMEALAKAAASAKAAFDAAPDIAPGSLNEANRVAEAAAIAQDATMAKAREEQMRKAMEAADKADKEVREGGIQDLEDALFVATKAFEESEKKTMQAADTLVAGTEAAAQALLGRNAANDPINRMAQQELAAAQKTVELLTKLLEEAKGRSDLKEAGFK